MAVKKKAKQPEHEYGAIHKIAVFLEQTRLAEYMDLMQRPHKLAWLNFWGGVWRGFGYGVGFVIMLSVFLWGLKFALHHAGGLPWIGSQVEEMIAWLLKVIEKRQGG